MMEQDLTRRAALLARRWGPAASPGRDQPPSTEARVLVVGPSPVSSAGLSSLLREPSWALRAKRRPSSALARWRSACPT
jgi:hypothetical protein